MGRTKSTTTVDSKWATKLATRIIHHDSWDMVLSPSRASAALGHTLPLVYPRGLIEPPEHPLDPLERLQRDIVAASKMLTLQEVGYLVTHYYTIQEYRKAAMSQERALDKEEDPQPHDVITWLAAQMMTLEDQIKRVLDRWTDTDRLSRWAKTITGIGPVIAAGLRSQVEVTADRPTAGHLWRFAGLDPTVEWEAGHKRPWNADLKTLVAYKIGESFVKVAGLESDTYGKVYVQRKAKEWELNLLGKFGPQCAEELATRKFKAEYTPRWYRGQYDPVTVREWLTAGRNMLEMPQAGATGRPGLPMLPPAHIHARARRYAVKLFLSHYHHVAYEVATGQKPPKPYVLDKVPGHTHYVAPPNWPDQG